MSARRFLHCLLVCGSLGLFACKIASEPAPSPGTLIAEDALLVDVRSDAEFAAGSLPGAIHIPHDEAATRLQEFGDQKRTVVLFCAAGGRAGRVKDLLESKGWTRVHNGGGINDLR
ncbi:MAG: sulfurtransferase [Rickettsiales bacterium]|nr:sulfurtransferase [Rickettsiales bacterium]|tara:strand:- start:420 stop:767 length:348 start_codon:yes stop_codon:yes gene_type:complete